MKKLIALIVIVVLIMVLGILTIVKQQFIIKTQNELLKTEESNNVSELVSGENKIEDETDNKVEEEPGVSEEVTLTREDVENALINEVYNGKDYIEDGIYGINNIRELLMDVDDDGYDEIFKFGNWLAEDESVFSLYKYIDGKVQEVNIENNEIFFLGKLYNTTDGVYISDIRSDGPESNIFLYKLVSDGNNFSLKEVLGEYHIHSPKDNLDDDLYRYEGKEYTEEEYLQKINILNENVYVNKTIGSYDWIENLWLTSNSSNSSSN